MRQTENENTPVLRIKGTETQSSLSLEEDLIQQTLRPKKNQEFLNSLTEYEKRWVEKHLRDEMKIHALLLRMRYGDPASAEISRNQRLRFREEMLGFLKNLVSEQRRKRG